MPQRKWSAWMRELGLTIRHAREFTGLTQAQLARRVGVSPGVVSRLEVGRAISAPLAIVLRVLSGLRTLLAEERPADLPADVHRLMELLTAGASGRSLASDQGVDTLLRLYQGMGTTERGRFILVVEAAAEAISSHPE